ncbi:MAG TPA: hypothetical protein VH575_00025 [Gemmataceae bacterium]|jgi:hypothetical protein
MSAKHIGLSGLIVALCGLGVVHAQGPAPAPTGADVPPADVLPLYTPNGSDAPLSNSLPNAAPSNAAPSASSSAPAGTTPEGVARDEGSPPIPPPVLPPLGLPASPWLVYPHSPCCCGPVGGKCGGPLGYELFVRSGMAFPVGGGIFGDFLRTGWDIEGGGRLLFFNPPATKAWTATLSVSNIFARTGNNNQPVELFNFAVNTAIPVPGQTNIPGSLQATTPTVVHVPQVIATVSSVNMTFANAGFGREWWLCGSAYPGKSAGWNWRVGVDGGGRWGSGMVQFNEFQHKTDVVGGVYAAMHTYLEYPWRCGFVFGGVRYEYNYIWTSFLQSQNNADFQSMNLLFQLGARF